MTDWWSVYRLKRSIRTPLPSWRRYSACHIVYQSGRIIVVIITCGFCMLLLHKTLRELQGLKAWPNTTCTDCATHIHTHLHSYWSRPYINYVLLTLVDFSHTSTSARGAEVLLSWFFQVHPGVCEFGQVSLCDHDLKTDRALFSGLGKCVWQLRKYTHTKTHRWQRPWHGPGAQGFFIIQTESFLFLRLCRNVT